MQTVRFNTTEVTRLEAVVPNHSVHRDRFWGTLKTSLLAVALACPGLATHAQTTLATSSTATAAPVSTQSPQQAPDAISPDGGAYYGPLRDGVMHGKGRLTWRNGDWYEGGFDQGLFSGQGTMVWVRGGRYDGHFLDGDFSGQGLLKWPGGDEYEGQFLNGNANGKGTIRYVSGDVYTGEFVDDEPHGQGQWVKSGGGIITGSFEFGQPAGHVTVEGNDGNRYEGMMSNWEFTGPGRIVQEDGTVIEGTLNGFAIEGKGTITYADGRKYRGDLVYNMPEGAGVLRFPNGDEYKGAFEYGQMHGAGVMRLAKPQADGKRVLRGQWQNGELEGRETRAAAAVETDAAPDTPAQWQANVNTVLYNQNTLLARAYAGLQPRTEGQTNLYALLVAGDGTQEVFRREVQFVDRLLAERFGAKGRIISLINSRTDVDKTPLATEHSVQRSLDAIAKVMDKEQDVLLLFLTSHGSSDHRLSLGMQSIRLENLPAKTLGTLLNNSGIRNKIVVVSACYSGGFIPELADDRTLVITAARADRTSFGCADENDFTYFGHALFKEAMAEPQSLTAAFEQAQGLVAQWEAGTSPSDDKGSEASTRSASRVSHSEPQISGTPAYRAWVDQQWLQWQKQAQTKP